MISFEGADDIIGLREWGTNALLPLRLPPRPELASAAAVLRLPRGRLATTAHALAFIHEDQSWRVRDTSGSSELKQDGIPTREANLRPGTEVAIADRTFIAESRRSIALRKFCFRMLGWSEDRLAEVDQALRAIRLASSRRAALVLSGRGDLVPVAHVLHRRMSGEDIPFVVCDPRRSDTPASARGPANCPIGMMALRRVSSGTLCVRTERLPRDFGDVLRTFRNPDSGVQLMVCAADEEMLCAARIEIPSLTSRGPELSQIVSEYVEDSIGILHAPSDCLKPQDYKWIAQGAMFTNEASIADIEKAALRTVALRMSDGDLSMAAKHLGMTRVSLERWVRRRESDSA